MRQAIINLVEAVRGLKLSRTHQPAPHCVKIGVAARELPEQLLTVLDAFEALEREGGAGLADQELDNIKAGLDGVFRWIKLQGLSTDEPLAIMAQALGAQGKKKPKSFPLLPSFTPGFTKRKSWKPKLSIAPGFSGAKTLDSMEEHIQQAKAMGEVVAKMGAAAPILAKAEEVERPGMGPR